MALLTLLAAGPARAQLVEQVFSPYSGPGVAGPVPTVLTRQQQDYLNSGVRTGSFIIRPLLQLSTGYETNVLATPNARGSPLLNTNAALEAVSDISRVNIRARVNLDAVRYFDLPSQSSTNWGAELGGSYELGRDLISAKVSHAQLVQTARDLDVPLGLDRAVPYRIENGQLSYRANFASLSITPAFDVSVYSYSNATAGGLFYAQDYRDRTLLTPSITVAYESSPGRSILVVVRNTSGVYRRAQAGFPRRDYNDTSFLGGVDFEVSGAIRLRGLVGYEVRSFDAASYRTIQSPVAEASAIWTPTRLTTVTAGLARRIADSADDTVAGLTETTARLRIEHEYLRNVLLLGTASISVDSYRDSGDQYLYQVGAASTYLVNRQVGLTASYDYISRSGMSRGLVGNLPIGSSYTDHRLLLQVRLTL